MGKAVKRNRAKRLLKAHFINLAKNNLASGIYILIAKEPILTSNYQKLSKQFLYIFQKLHLITKREQNKG